MPPAFILSQDQTLNKYIFIFCLINFPSYSKLTFCLVFKDHCALLSSCTNNISNQISKVNIFFCFFIFFSTFLLKFCFFDAFLLKFIYFHNYYMHKYLKKNNINIVFFNLLKELIFCCCFVFLFFCIDYNIFLLFLDKKHFLFFLPIQLNL